MLVYHQNDRRLVATSNRFRPFEREPKILLTALALPLLQYLGPTYLLSLLAVTGELCTVDIPCPDMVEGSGGERERERELFRERVLHLSSQTGLMQVLPGHPLADPIREC